MRNEPMRRNDLPETCFSILPSSGQLIIIRCGERGYYPSEWDTGSREENREIASSHNARRGITDIQEAAMLAGSMFGWNTPGANPQWYLDNARYVNSSIVQGHIKDPIMSVYYPVSSFLGYVWLTIGVNPVYVDTGIRIESAADLCYRCLDDVATDVLYMTGNDHALEAADPLELAEIKRRWEPYINQLPDYAYLCKDLLNGKM